MLGQYSLSNQNRNVRYLAKIEMSGLSKTNITDTSLLFARVLIIISP